MNNHKNDDQGFNFERLPNGDIAITHDDMGRCRTVINAGIWVSIVLSMTAFNERPNDWHRFMEYHQGRRDILSLGRPCQVPPPGWYCTRAAGHEGPCAALPSE